MVAPTAAAARPCGQPLLRPSRREHPVERVLEAPLREALHKGAVDERIARGDAHSAADGDGSKRDGARARGGVMM